MKKIILLSVALISVQLLIAQKNEISLSFSNQFWNDSQVYDGIYADQQFSLGLEYRRQVGKVFDLETGISYSKYKIPYSCHTCDLIDPDIYNVNELSTKIGARWRIFENNKWMIYTSAGAQVNVSSQTFDVTFPENKEWTGNLYHDLGLRYKVNKNLSFDLEFKTQYNLSDYNALLKSRTNYGAGVRLAYSF